MLTARIPPPGVFGTVAAPGRQYRHVTADARQASLVSGHSVYRMRVPYDHSRFSKLANNIIQLFYW